MGNKLKVLEYSVGDSIYIPSSLYLGHGVDDIQGGSTTIVDIDIDSRLPSNHYNKYMVIVEGLPQKKYNLRYLLENQKKWEKIYKNQKAHSDPDLRPEFNKGF